MNNFLIWKDCNQPHLYELYRIFLRNLENHNRLLKTLENYKFQHILPEVKDSYFESEEFIQEFIMSIYKNSSKKISEFDRPI